ncbi:MAG: DNA polymerase ligase N-terminal domain-containing protein [Frankia sp.]
MDSEGSNSPKGPGPPVDPSPSLATYRAKRRPGRTPEPGLGTADTRQTANQGRPPPDPPTADAAATVTEGNQGVVEPDHTGNDQAGRGERFVVQEHHARTLHWDFRLERDGVLVSWAVPKGIPPDPALKRLAHHVEDHPLDYAAFEGTIEPGQYGAGSVTVWDHGTYTLEKWTPREVKIVLAGERVRGRYVLIRTRGEDWIMRRMDPPTDPDRHPPPERLEPMLAVPGRLPTDARQWAYEVKWDGVRVLSFITGGRVRALGRSGRDVTAAYPELRAVGLALGSTEVVLDGEIVAFGPDGKPDFGLLAHRMHVTDAAAARRLAKQTPVSYVVFDLLHLDGHDTTGLTYAERRTLLAGLPGLNVPAAFDADGDAVLAASRQAGLEGLVAKRRASVYRPGHRSSDWVKVKNIRRQSVVIGGWEPGEGRRADTIGALLFGLPAPAEAAGPAGRSANAEPSDAEPTDAEPTNAEPSDAALLGRLIYAGQVGTGFTDATLAHLMTELETRRTASSPFVEVPREYARSAVWVRPDLVADVDYTAWTADGRLRHPSFKGLRTDLDARAVVREDTGNAEAPEGSTNREADG